MDLYAIGVALTGTLSNEGEWRGLESPEVERDWKYSNIDKGITGKLLNSPFASVDGTGIRLCRWMDELFSALGPLLTRMATRSGVKWTPRSTGRQCWLW